MPIGVFSSVRSPVPCRDGILFKSIVIGFFSVVAYRGLGIMELAEVNLVTLSYVVMVHKTIFVRRIV